MSLPTTITGLRRADGKNSIASAPLPALDGDKVLVKIAAAPINPSDVGPLKGHYSSKDPVAFAGLEGTGVIIATGPDSKSLQGKRVSFFTLSGDQGSYANYAVVSASTVVPLPDSIDDEQGATALVNPLTVEMFLHECEKGNHKALVHNAAASALGQQLLAAATKKGIKVINLVRRAENVATLKKQGAEYVVDTTVDGWEDEFRALTKTVKPSVFFDPVGGSAGTKIIQLMPDGSTTFLYGVLDDSSHYTLSFVELAMQRKNISGLIVFHALAEPETGKKLIANAIANLSAKVYQTTIYKKYPVSQFEAALKDYEANASKGKILLVPDN